MSEKVQIGRLALRVEGDWWVAYAAQTDTMDGAIDLGRIRMSLAQHQDVKQRFMTTMRAAFAEALKAATGHEALWLDAIQPAPEHERAGRG